MVKTVNPAFCLFPWGGGTRLADPTATAMGRFSFLLCGDLTSHNHHHRRCRRRRLCVVLYALCSIYPRQTPWPPDLPLFLPPTAASVFRVSPAEDLLDALPDGLLDGDGAEEPVVGVAPVGGAVAKGPAGPGVEAGLASASVLRGRGRGRGRGWGWV